jgi:hypothetical protein
MSVARCLWVSAWWVRSMENLVHDEYCTNKQWIRRKIRSIPVICTCSLSYPGPARPPSPLAAGSVANFTPSPRRPSLPLPQTHLVIRASERKHRMRLPEYCPEFAINTSHAKTREVRHSKYRSHFVFSSAASTSVV